MRWKLFILLPLLAIAVSLLVGLAIWGSRGGETGTTGLKVVLYKKQDSFRLGEPMRFTVVVENHGFRSVTRDFQIYLHEIFEVRGPDGAEVPVIRADSSSFGGPTLIKPFMGLYVRVATDLLEEYMISKEGEYTVQVKKLADDLPASNVVKFTVSGGDVPEIDEHLSRILPLLPERWDGGRYEYDFYRGPVSGREAADFLYLQLNSGGRSTKRIHVYMCKTEADPKEKLAPRERMSRFLGRAEGGLFVYIDVLPETEESWPTFEADLKHALEIR